MGRNRFPPNNVDPKILEKFGPRFEIEVGLPIMRHTGGNRLAQVANDNSGRLSRMPALVDTGAGHTVLTPSAIEKVGLPLVGYTTVSRLGGEQTVAAHVASIQFPRNKLAPIEILRVLCCDIPGGLYQCLIGRDVLSRWIFTYVGKTGEWFLDEEDVSAWVEPPDGLP